MTIKGIYGREMYDISPVIAHRFHYTEYEEGFEAMASGNSGKVVLSWE